MDVKIRSQENLDSFLPVPGSTNKDEADPIF